MEKKRDITFVADEWDIIRVLKIAINTFWSRTTRCLAGLKMSIMSWALDSYEIDRRWFVLSLFRLILGGVAKKWDFKHGWVQEFKARGRNTI
jgi:hypothetical protein